MRLPNDKGEPETGASPPMWPGTAERARMFILAAHTAGFDVVVLLGVGARLIPFAPDEARGTPPSARFYAGILKQFGEGLVREHSLDVGQLVEGVTIKWHNINAAGQDVEFDVRWATVEDLAALASDRLRGRGGLHWSKADAADLADLIDALVMRANRSHHRSAA